MKNVILFLLFGLFSLSAAGEFTSEITCDIEGQVTQLFFDGKSDAEGVLSTGEIIVARSSKWSDSDIPELATLENIAMEVEFPFRLAGQPLDCEVYHPSRWWFNSPEFMQILERYAPVSDKN